MPRRRPARRARCCGCSSTRCRSAAARVDVVGAKEGERALDEGDDGRGALVGVQLGVGQAAVVVDRRVGELLADPARLLGAGPVTVAGDLVAGRDEARKALGVDLDQVARARPLEPAHLLARRGWAAATARAARGSETVACARSSSTAISRGPQPVRRRAAQTRSWTSSLDPAAGGAASRGGPRPTRRTPALRRRAAAPSRPSSAPSPANVSPGRGLATRLTMTSRHSSASSIRCHGAATYACPASGPSLL